MSMSDKVIILGANQQIISALRAQGINAVEGSRIAEEKERIGELKLLSARPYHYSYSELHPNDNWRGTGRKKTIFK